MIRIADHIDSAEPLGEGNRFYKALGSKTGISVVQVFPFTLSPEQYPFFEKQVSLLNEAIHDYRATIPRILSWGFTETGFFPFMEMEWIDGYDLAELTNRHYITIDEISKIAEQVSRVLTHCHNLGIVHGNINSKHILWDKKREYYFLTGFQFGLQSATLQDGPASPQKDINDLGLVLFQLLKKNLLPDTRIELTDLGSLSLPKDKIEDVGSVPAWLVNCIIKASGAATEEKFKSASEMYHYILLHHKTPFQKRKWYRSKPQQPLTVPSKPLLKTRNISTQKVRSVLNSGLRKGRKQVRFVFDRRIAVGLIMAALLFGFSIVAQKRERKLNNEFSETNKNALQQDTGTLAVKENNTKNNPPLTGKEKNKPDTDKTTGDKKRITVQKTAPAKPDTEQQVTGNVDLGAYKVRGKAYFHNEPDETTRRNAFIVHWNNAILHPLKEENGFVYIIFTNHQGQITKGWLRKMDLVKQ